jgi:hypothetical protein
VFPAAYPHAARRLPIIADKGHTGAGIGVLAPVKGHHLDPGAQAANRLKTSPRAPSERPNSPLKPAWRAPRRVTASPSRIGAITAALVPTTMKYEPRCENLITCQTLD